MTVSYENESDKEKKSVGNEPSTETADVLQDVESDTPGLKRSLKNRHMQMIAIGGSIGAGLFVGSGSALSSGGPGALVVDFMIIGFMMLCTVNALGELACMYPVSGSFYNYSIRFIDPAWGFAMGWNYSLNWLIVLPFELTTAGITIAYWTDPNQTGNPTINVGVWIAIFLVFIGAIFFLGVKGFGEVEFVLGIIKVTAIIGFIILGTIINCGGVPTDPRGYIGAKYWHDPGAFRNGFKGFCSVFVTASFAFGGTEMVGVASAEAENPRKAIPKATKQVSLRIVLFYIVSLFILGLIVPSDDTSLSMGTEGATKYSPFVLSIKLAGIKVLPSIFNAVITLSVLSVANSSTFAATRTVKALCESGMGPSIGAKVDKKGRPWVISILVFAIGFLAFVSEGKNGTVIFTWLLSLSGLSNFFTWGSICYSHIRFRKVWALNGRSVDDLPFASPFGVMGSWIGLGLNILCLIAQFYLALFPIGLKPSAKIFFESYLAFPVVILFFAGYKIYYKQWEFGVDLRSINVDEGRRDVDLEELKKELEEERAKKANWPWWRKIMDKFI